MGLSANPPTADLEEKTGLRVGTQFKVTGAV
jgi:hypothetical protein